MLPVDDPDTFIPECGPDGINFTRRQSFGDDSWCVDPVTGDEIEGTRTGVDEPQVSCDSAEVQ